MTAGGVGNAGESSHRAKPCQITKKSSKEASG